MADPFAVDKSQRPRSTRRAARVVVPLSLAAAGIGLASAMVWTASNAAFTATTQNGVNTFATGTISLADNDSNAVLFSPAAMNPGDTLTRCIRVTYTGSITTSQVTLYAASGTATNGLDQYIDITIERGTDTTPGGPAFGSCTNFGSPTTIFATDDLFTFRQTKNSFANGVDNWAPAATNETRDYRFTYTFSNSAPNSVMASTASVTFQWESQV